MADPQRHRRRSERATTAEERTAHTLEAAGRRCWTCPQPPRRMESFDISNTGASDIVASMVVYQRDEAFEIRLPPVSDQGADWRPSGRLRLHAGGPARGGCSGRRTGTKSSCRLPDVFLIDGGVTHADAVRAVAEQFGCTVPIFGMVKDDRHRTRALVTPEGREIGIVNDQAVFSLIGQIQEETHRFAITYHHQHHTKSAMRSALDGVPGLGPKRQAELRKHFGTVKAIREADETALAAVLPQNVAHTLWIRLHEKEST